MRVRRCNRQCYEAKSKQCRCQCNGHNHGVGAERARGNFRRLGMIWDVPNGRCGTTRARKEQRISSEQGRLFP